MAILNEPKGLSDTNKVEIKGYIPEEKIQNLPDPPTAEPEVVVEADEALLFPRVDTCCGCISLAKGTLLIAWYHVILYIVVTIAFLLNLIATVMAEKEVSASSEVVPMFWSLLCIYSAVKLVQGVKKGNIHFIHYYLQLVILIFVIGFIAFIIVIAINGKRMDPSLIAGILAGKVILLGTEVYFYLVVYNYYKKLRALLKLGPMKRHFCFFV